MDRPLPLRSQQGSAIRQQGSAILEALLSILIFSMGVLAVALAAVNVFGGFLVTRRMLEMFKKKEKKPASGGQA